MRGHGGMARIEADPRQFALLARNGAGIALRLRGLGEFRRAAKPAEARIIALFEEDAGVAQHFGR